MSRRLWCTQTRHFSDFWQGYYRANYRQSQPRTRDMRKRVTMNPITAVAGRSSRLASIWPAPPQLTTDDASSSDDDNPCCRRVSLPSLSLPPFLIVIVASVRCSSQTIPTATDPLPNEWRFCQRYYRLLNSCVLLSGGGNDRLNTQGSIWILSRALHLKCVRRGPMSKCSGELTEGFLNNYLHSTTINLKGAKSSYNIH